MRLAKCAIVLLCSATACGDDGSPVTAPPAPAPSVPDSVSDTASDSVAPAASATLVRIEALPRSGPGPYFEPGRILEIDEANRRATVTDELRPVDPEGLAALERAWRRRVPPDLRSFLSRYDGGTIAGDGTALIVFGPSEALEHVEHSIHEMARGHRIFGTDGGGSLYTYGPRGVWLVPMGAPDARFHVAASFAELVERIIRGDDLHESR